MRRAAIIAFALGIWPASAVPAARGSEVAVLVVVGAQGTEDYGKQYLDDERQWKERCREGNVEYHVVGLDPEPAELDGDEGTNLADTDRARLQRLLQELAGREDQTLWVVLIGHGTFDGREAKFNLRGPDVSVNDLKSWLEPKTSDLVFINTTSSSAPFLTGLSAPGRIVVTATKSGDEMFYTRFGGFFAGALADPDADLDHDGQTSLLETFLTASRRVQSYFEERGLLATEHALIDDNGDKKGTRADWFQGVRVTKKTEDDLLPDGLRAQQLHLIFSEEERSFPPGLRSKRNELELRIAELHYRRDKLSDEDYYAKLEELFLQIAEIYRQAEAAQSP